jgi:Icc-related predicted phosphoesterase
MRKNFLSNCGKARIMGDRIRVVLVSDLHGSEIAYAKLANIPKIYKADIVILNGDLTGKALMPIIKLKNGQYTANVFGEVKTFDEKKLEEVIRDAKNSGYYPYVVDEDEYNELLNNNSKVRESLVKLMISSFDDWMRKVEERYRQFNVKLFYFPGNDDPHEFVDHIKHIDNDTLIYGDEKILEINKYVLLGFGYSNPTPWHTERELPEDEIKRRLENLFGNIEPSKMTRVLAAIHVPPYGTTIDLAPKLTPDLRPVTAGGEMVMDHVGSTAVREILEKYGPAIGLHGHIHESPGIDYLQCKCGRKVPVVNAGSEYMVGALRLAYLIIEDGKLKDKIFVRG